MTLEHERKTCTLSVGLQDLLAQLDQVTARRMQGELARLNERTVEQVADERVHGLVGCEQVARSLLHHLLQRLRVPFQQALLLLDLPSQLMGLDGTMQRGHEVDTINRFLDEIVGPTS